jgi:hypothetical protein
MAKNRVLNEIGDNASKGDFEKDFEELLQSFDLEFNLYEKMKGSPLLFESSVFQFIFSKKSSSMMF